MLSKILLKHYKPLKITRLNFIKKFILLKMSLYDSVVVSSLFVAVFFLFVPGFVIQCTILCVLCNHLA